MNYKIQRIVLFIVMLAIMLTGILQLIVNKIQAASGQSGKALLSSLLGIDVDSGYQYNIADVGTIFELEYTHTSGPWIKGYQSYCIQPGTTISTGGAMSYSDMMAEDGKIYTSLNGHAKTDDSGNCVGGKSYKTTTVYKCTEVGELPPALAYIIAQSGGVQDGWSLDKQRAVWHMRDSTVYNALTGQNENADLDLIQGNGVSALNGDSTLDQAALDYANSYYAFLAKLKGVNTSNTNNEDDIIEDNSDEVKFTVANSATQEYSVGPFNLSYTEATFEEEDDVDLNVVEIDGYEFPKYTSNNGKRFIEYKQNYGPWHDKEFDGSIMEEKGSSLAVLATIASGYGFDYTPEKWLGSEFNMKDAISDLGLGGEEPIQNPVSQAKQEIQENLKNGNPVIICQDGGISSGEQQFIAILDIDEDENQVYMSNPYSENITGWVSIDSILNSLNSYYLISDPNGVAEKNGANGTNDDTQDNGNNKTNSLSFGGISNMIAKGYNSKGELVKDNIIIKKFLLKNNSTGQYESSKNPSYYSENANADGSVAPDTTEQVYPASGQDFFVVIDNPNAGLASDDDDNFVTYISIDVGYEITLYYGKYSYLEGHVYTLTYRADHTYNNRQGCMITPVIQQSDRQDGMIADVRCITYRQTVELNTQPDTPDTPTPGTTTPGTPTPGTPTPGTPTPGTPTPGTPTPGTPTPGTPTPGTPTPGTPTPGTPTPGTPTPGTPTTPSSPDDLWLTIKKKTVKITMDLGGHVWEDAFAEKESVADGLSSTLGFTTNGQEKPMDKPLKNVKVTLYTEDGEIATLHTNPKEEAESSNILTLVNPTYTDENGDFLFRSVDPMKKYYVTYEYNGQIYTATEYLNAPSGKQSSVKAMYDAELYDTDEWKFTSKATEKTDERDAYDEKFASIGSYPENYVTSNSIGLLNGTYNASFTQRELMGYTLGKDGNYSKTGVQLIDGYEYDSNGVERTDGNFSEGAITKAIKDFININYAYPSDEQIKQIYQNIAGNDVETARKLQFIEDCKIKSYTKSQNGNYDLYPVIDEFIINTNTTTETHFIPGDERTNYRDVHLTIEKTEVEMIHPGDYYINLGLWRRPQMDTSIRKDVYKAGLTINGRAETYEYDDRAGVSDEGDDALWEIGVRVSEANYGNYYGENYNRAIYPADAKADTNPTISENERLQIYITYKITVRNRSQSVQTQIDEVVDYYDSDYELVPNMSWVMYSDDHEDKTQVRIPADEYLKIIKAGNVSALGNSKYKALQESTTGKYSDNAKSKLNGYENIYINGLQNHKLEAGENEYIYLTFRVKRDGNGLMLDQGNEAKQNIVEINGYTTYYNNNTVLPNGINKNSGNHAGILDMNSTPGNFDQTDLNEEKYEHLFEDDTDRARGIKIYIDEQLERKINGTVWEDKRTYTPDGTNALIANGVMDEGEVGIQGIPVTLYDVAKNQPAYVYNEGEWKPATTVTDNNGNYEFGGYIPGDVIELFSYGGEKYNGQDYKSTSYQRNLATGEAIDQNGRTDISSDGSLGYEGYINVEAQNSAGSYGYSISKTDEFVQRVSDAKDLWEDRQNVNSSYATEVKNNTAEALATKQIKPEMRAVTGVIRVEVEYNREKTDGNTSGNYVIRNVDFGLEERPKAQLELNNQVSNVKITLSDGTVLFDAEQTATDLIWQSKKTYNINEMKKETSYDKIGPSANGTGKNNVYSDYRQYDAFRQAVLDRVNSYANKNKGLIIATMDEEIMHGSTIEIMYNLSVTNVGEEDYNEPSFYYIGKVANNGTIVKTKADQVVDYIGNNLRYNQNNNAAEWGWSNITDSDLKAGGLINEGVANAIASQYNTILVTTGLNKELVPLVQNGNEGNSVASTNLILSHVQGTTQNTLYNNIAEIISVSNTVGRRMAYSVQGNQNPVPPKGSRMVDITEPDASSSEEVGVTSPYGTYYIYIGLAVAVIAIIAIGVVIIKKKVLKK